MDTTSRTEQTLTLSGAALWKIKAKIHAFYIISILLGIIILLASVRFGNIPNLGDRLSFALTLASLLLAILAIGYNVVSNTSFSQTISTLNEVSRDVSETAKGISIAAKDLAIKIETIPTRLESMEGRLTESQSHVIGLSSSFESFKQAFEDKGTQATHPTPVEQLTPNQIAKLFHKAGNVGVLFALYKSRNAELNISDRAYEFFVDPYLEKKDDEIMRTYLRGIYLGQVLILDSLGLITRTDKKISLLPELERQIQEAYEGNKQTQSAPVNSLIKALKEMP